MNLKKCVLNLLRMTNFVVANQAIKPGQSGP